MVISQNNAYLLIGMRYWKNRSDKGSCESNFRFESIPLDCKKQLPNRHSESMGDRQVNAAKLRSWFQAEKENDDNVATERKVVDKDSYLLMKANKTHRDKIYKERRVVTDIIGEKKLHRYIDQLQRVQQVERKRFHLPKKKQAASQVNLIVSQHCEEQPLRDLRKEQQQKIEEIYHTLGNLEKMGYPDRKINEWIYNFSAFQRPYMLELTMKPLKKKNFSRKINFEYERDVAEFSVKYRRKKKKIHGKETGYDLYDLQEYQEHLEEIVIQKNSNKIKEIKESIIDKMVTCWQDPHDKGFSIEILKKKRPREVNNFVGDLTDIETHYGQLNLVTRTSKFKFCHLNDCERDIKISVDQAIKESALRASLKF